MSRNVNLFTVPAGEPFLAVLAEAVLKGGFPAPGNRIEGPLDLARWTILLPTRRARRAMASAFLDEGGGTRLLPRIRAIGDPDEDDFLWPQGEEEPGSFDLPPAIPPIKRLFLLANLIRDWAGIEPRGRLARALVQSPAQTIALARSLASLMDMCETEGKTLDGIAQLLDGELAGHQQAALDFLAIARMKFPEKLQELGLIGPMRRRNLLLAEEARRLAEAPPLGPVIAAGSTGSIPATADLLSVIARLDQGAVVLPGLDLAMDEESWEKLGPQHPQYGMAQLLRHLGVERGRVQLLSKNERTPSNFQSRFWLASEVMRPADTTDCWHEATTTQASRIHEAVEGVETIEAPDRREEALAIALVMRKALETPGRACALVTPDRRLARRVKAELRRWDIAIDDTAGEPLIRTPAGAFMGLITDAAAQGFDPLSMAALLDHPLCRLGLGRARVVPAARALEAAVLRSRKPVRGLASLAGAMEAARSRTDPYVHPSVVRIGERGWDPMARLVERLSAILGPLGELFESGEALPLSGLLGAHLQAAEAAASGPDGASLWTGPEADALSSLFSELMAEARHLPPLKPAEYPRFIDEFLAMAPVRPEFGRHPRLAMLGLLEARLVDADVTILGGLNEGVWPQIAESDPWLNRPQRKSLGLPVPERRIGLAAHDFVQAFCRGQVHLTWSRKIAGVPAVTSRWVMRLKALLAAAKAEDKVAPAEPWIAWTHALDRPAATGPIARPRVSPPIELRPRRLSVTRIEELMRDPYAAFARHILKVRALDPLGGDLGPLERGQIVHKAIQTFTSKYPGALPEDALERLMEEARSAFHEFGVDEETAAFWWPRMRRLGEWFLDTEAQLRIDAVEQRVEIGGELAVNDSFTLTARADRIDRLRDGTLRILDYKTGVLPTFNEDAKAFSPQLLLEAHMAPAGGFKDVGAAPASAVCYLRLSGGDPAGECKILGGAELADRIEATRQGLLQLVAAYADPATAYEARDWSDNPAGERDYGHLSRWREWSGA